MSNSRGTLFVVATPLGNLGDISARAVETLRSVDLVAAEDTRHSGKLLKHFEIDTATCSLHEHNEASRVAELVDMLEGGNDVALISDAGTPLISDPGYRLVHAAREANIVVSPVPGPSAVTAALSVSGLATDRFLFEGFLPSRPSARRKRFEELANVQAILVFFESPNRIATTLEEARKIFGDREAALARELTKLHETIYGGTLSELSGVVATNANARRGEIVLIVAGQTDRQSHYDANALLRELLTELPPRKAASLAARLTGRSSRELYAVAVDLKR